MARPRIIYDFGSNNGDDIPYYLLRSDRVVAVEANPSLCAVISDRFADAIASERLIVVNAVATDDSTCVESLFYIHKTNPVLSRLTKPQRGLADFEEVSLPCATASSIVKQYGQPYYVKIDIEHFDEHVLRDLFTNCILPPYISAESQDIGVFAMLVALGGYNAFKLVDGRSVESRYRNRILRCDHGNVTYSFPFHSAGPFGEDIDGPWMSANAFARLLAFEGLGWKDVHATNQVAPDPAANPSEWGFFRRRMREALWARVPARLAHLLSRRRD